MQLNAYLTFNGQCEAAFKFYGQCLGGKIETLMTYASAPADSPVPPEFRDRIMYARLNAGGGILLACDASPDWYQAPQGFSVSVGIAGLPEAERIFHALAEGGTIRMPFQKTFWAPGFGMLVDRFGISWMVNCEQSQE